MAYHYLGHYIDKDSPNFEKLLERAVHETYKKGKRYLIVKRLLNAPAQCTDRETSLYSSIKLCPSSNLFCNEISK